MTSRPIAQRKRALPEAKRRVIAFVNLKGGATKTTSALLTAIELALRGHSVTFFDLDSQGSATNWARLAEEDGAPLPFEVRPANIASLRGYTPTTDYTIVDTPPTDPGATDAAIKVADVIVVPSPTGFMETDRTWETAGVAATQVPTYVLITRWDRRTQDAPDFAAELDARGVARFDTVIPEKKALQRERGNLADPAAYGYDTFTTELLEVL